MNKRFQNSLILVLFMLATSGCGKKEPSAPVDTVKEEDKVPKISAVQAEYDFGAVKQGAEVSHIYKIKNVGTKELVIEKTRGS